MLKLQALLFFICAGVYCLKGLKNGNSSAYEAYLGNSLQLPMDLQKWTEKSRLVIIASMQIQSVGKNCNIPPFIKQDFIFKTIMNDCFHLRRMNFTCHSLVVTKLPSLKILLLTWPQNGKQYKSYIILFFLCVMKDGWEMCTYCVGCKGDNVRMW